jgi:tetratricopeptide (TPR) repeat protein
VRTPLIVEWYRALPQPRPPEDSDLWAARLGQALDDFRVAVAARYSESTLQRLLNSPDPDCRRAAVVALGLLGTMRVNAAVAAHLRDGDEAVRHLASDALWAIWFRGDTPRHNEELQRLARLDDARAQRRGLDALIRRARDFAEAYNQRAILSYRLGEFRDAIADCETTLRLNPHHFGAAAGMAQCFLRLKKPRAALRSFRTALAINPNLDDVEAAVKALEEVLGE